MLIHKYFSDKYNTNFLFLHKIRHKFKIFFIYLASGFSFKTLSLIFII